VLAIPALVSFFYFTKRVVDEGDLGSPLDFSLASQGNLVFSRFEATGFAIEALPAFFYTVFLAISWFYLWVIRYAALIFPETLIRITNLIARLFNASEAGFRLTHCE
jgi:hypothetical protein